MDIATFYINLKIQGEKKMSIISVVYLPEGIVLAADSRLTGRKEYKDDNDNNVVCICFHKESVFLNINVYYSFL